jgi:hypothetical protein
MAFIGVFAGTDDRALASGFVLTADKGRGRGDRSNGGGVAKETTTGERRRVHGCDEFLGPPPSSVEERFGRVKR